MTDAESKTLLYPETAQSTNTHYNKHDLWPDPCIFTLLFIFLYFNFGLIARQCYDRIDCIILVRQQIRTRKLVLNIFNIILYLDVY